VLDDLDRELERRGHRFVRYANAGSCVTRMPVRALRGCRFVRYADDCNIYVHPMAVCRDEAANVSTTCFIFSAALSAWVSDASVS